MGNAFIHMPNPQHALKKAGIPIMQPERSSGSCCGTIFRPNPIFKYPAALPPDAASAPTVPAIVSFPRMI